MITVTQKGRHSTHISRIRRLLKKEMGKELMHGHYIRSVGRELNSEQNTSCGC
jgi:hypothetical protein